MRSISTSNGSEVDAAARRSESSSSPSRPPLRVDHLRSTSLPLLVDIERTFVPYFIQIYVQILAIEKIIGHVNKNDVITCEKR